MTINGKRVAVVTGAAGGLGAVFAEALAAAGLSVAGIDLADMAEPRRRVEAHGMPFIDCIADITDPGLAAAAVSKAANALGGIDVLVNNAGIFPMIRFEDTTPAQWRGIMSVNLDGMFYVTHAALPWLTHSLSGRIVNIASAVVWLGPPGMVAYTASKGGVIGFTRALASELGPTGVTVNAITPSMIPTQTAVATGVVRDLDRVVAGQAVPEVQQPADLVSTLLYLCDPASRFVTGSAINVDGGHAKH
ncbi:MAG TPA: SDR family NAD(P)-dependent oxidoreductase [Mycobacteriales bacterium]|nr:SDR family NAD(P)-dependent oxidoreductase [Mycobacteriales bacterium]